MGLCRGSFVCTSIVHFKYVLVRPSTPYLYKVICAYCASISRPSQCPFQIPETHTSFSGVQTWKVIPPSSPSIMHSMFSTPESLHTCISTSLRSSVSGTESGHREYDILRRISTTAYVASGVVLELFQLTICMCLCGACDGFFIDTALSFLVPLASVSTSQTACVYPDGSTCCQYAHAR